MLGKYSTKLEEMAEKIRAGKKVVQDAAKLIINPHTQGLLRETVDDLQFAKEKLLSNLSLEDSTIKMPQNEDPDIVDYLM
jgi:hypothetical protein